MQLMGALKATRLPNSPVWCSRRAYLPARQDKHPDATTWLVTEQGLSYCPFRIPAPERIFLDAYISPNTETPMLNRVDSMSGMDASSVGRGVAGRQLFYGFNEWVSW
jgi:hypothetical protein